MPEANYDHNYLLIDRMTGEYVDPEEYEKGGYFKAAGNEL